MEALDLINVNVYMTNILLLLPILFIILIIRKIHHWKENKLVIQQFYFLSFWYILLFVFIIGILLSTMYHFYMFENTPAIHKIAILDVQASAPTLAIICFLLFIFYFLYLNHPCVKTVLSIKHVTMPIYWISVICSSIGVASYLIKWISIPESHLNLFTIYKKNINDNDMMWGLCIHIFFHYMVYTGVSLLFLLYYIEIRPIFKAFFNSYDI